MTDSGKEILNKAYNQGWLSGFDFSLLIQDMAISEKGYVITQVIGKMLMLKLPYDWQNK